MVRHNALQHVAIELRAGSGTSAVAGHRFAFFDKPSATDFFELIASPDHPWDTLVRSLAKNIAGSGYDHPAVALFQLFPEATACFIFGEIQVELTTDDDKLQLGANNVSTWLETQIPERIHRIAVGNIDEEPIGQIRDGYITSGGFVVTLDESTPADEPSAGDSPKLLAAAVIERAPEPETEPEEFDPMLTTAISGAQLSAIKKEAGIATDTRRSSAAGTAGNPDFVRPKLRGIRCSARHLNSMQDRTCRTCGADVDRSGKIEDDTRPTLAIITFDDGTEFALDRPMVIGRKVTEPYAIGDEVAIPVSLVDESKMISRVHLEIHLVGWDIELIDKGSANGTFTRPLDTGGTKIRLRPEAPTPIALGTEVEVGGRKFSITAGPFEG